jgi:hypothetical protein
MRGFEEGKYDVEGWMSRGDRGEDVVLLLFGAE